MSLHRFKDVRRWVQGPGAHYAMVWQVQRTCSVDWVYLALSISVTALDARRSRSI